MTSLSSTKLETILTERGFAAVQWYGVEGCARVGVLQVEKGGYLLVTIPIGMTLKVTSYLPIVEGPSFPNPRFLSEWRKRWGSNLGVIGSLSLITPENGYLLPEGSGLDQLPERKIPRSLRLSPSRSAVVLIDRSGKEIPEELADISEGLSAADFAPLSKHLFPSRESGDTIGIPLLVYSLSEFLAETRHLEKREDFRKKVNTTNTSLREEVLTVRTTWAEKIDRKFTRLGSLFSETAAIALTGQPPESFDTSLSDIERALETIRESIRNLQTRSKSRE